MGRQDRPDLPRFLSYCIFFYFGFLPALRVFNPITLLESDGYMAPLYYTGLPHDELFIRGLPYLVALYFHV